MVPAQTFLSLTLPPTHISSHSLFISLHLCSHVSSLLPLYLSLFLWSSSFLPFLFPRSQRYSPVLDFSPRLLPLPFSLTRFLPLPPSPLLSVRLCLFFNCFSGFKSQPSHSLLSNSARKHCLVVAISSSSLTSFNFRFLI